MAKDEKTWDDVTDQLCETIRERRRHGHTLAEIKEDAEALAMASVDYDGGTASAECRGAWIREYCDQLRDEATAYAAAYADAAPRD